MMQSIKINSINDSGQGQTGAGQKREIPYYK